MSFSTSAGVRTSGIVETFGGFTMLSHCQSFLRTDPEELQAVSIDFNRTPGMTLNEFGKIDFKLFQS